jgi:prevent-host-death family protein
VTVRAAREQLRALLDDVQAGEEIVVLRRGVEVARLVPASRRRARLPDLSGLRSAVRVRGAPVSAEVIAARREGRY